MIEVLDRPEPSENPKRSLRDLIDNGYEFDFGKYIERAFQLWSKDIVGFSLYSLLTVVIVIVSVFTLVGPIFLTYPLLAGFYIVAGKISRGEQHEFGDFFKGFDHFKDLLIMTLILIAFYVIIFLVTLPGTFLGGADLFEFIHFAASIYLGTIYMLAIPFIVFGQFTAWTAMEASRKIVHKNFWWFLLLLIVSSIIASVGLIALIIGVFVTFSLQHIIYFSVYEEVIGLSDRSSEARDIVK